MSSFRIIGIGIFLSCSYVTNAFHRLALGFAPSKSVTGSNIHSGPSSASLFVLSLSASNVESDRQNKEEDSQQFPDYGKTSVEVDKIKLSKIQRKWKRNDLFGNTMIDQTLEELKNDKEFQGTQQRLETLGAAKMSKIERKNRGDALKSIGVEFPKMKLKRKDPTILQMNIGLYCNQACAHCHVESSPLRKQDVMSAEIAARCIELLSKCKSIKTLELTGGAPELCPTFRYLIATAREKFGDDLEIIDRCNLTVLQEPGQEDLVDFLKEHNVRVIASLPCYSADNVNQQRGNGVFDRSIAALIALNEAGFGTGPDSKYGLDLVYNPLGAFLPPPQDKLEVQYKEQLATNFGITFNNLYTITNMPIKRFADFLYRRDELKDYMDLLARNYNPNTVKSLMCLDLVSIGYDGKIYDCDFNQQLGYVLGDGDSIHEGGLSVTDIDSFEDLKQYDIRTDNHCFGCTAGMGSS